MDDKRYIMLREIEREAGSAYISGLARYLVNELGRAEYPARVLSVCNGFVNAGFIKGAIKEFGGKGSLRRVYTITAKGRKALKSRREDVKRIYGL